jgi:hypothetical protein
MAVEFDTDKWEALQEAFAQFAEQIRILWEKLVETLRPFVRFVCTIYRKLIGKWPYRVLPKCGANLIFVPMYPLVLWFPARE